MKQILGIGLCICLFAPFIGTWSWLHVEKRHIRDEVEKRMQHSGFDKTDLVLLTFTKAEAESELVWHHTGEFEYAGQKYDIVESDTDGDLLLFWCWLDHAETKIDQQLVRCTENHTNKDQQKQESQKRLTDFFRTLCYASSPGDSSFLYIGTITPDTRCRAYPTHVCNPPPTPPPEIV